MQIFAYLCNTRTPKPLNNAQIGGRFIFIPQWQSISRNNTTARRIWPSCYPKEDLFSKTKSVSADISAT